MQDEISPPGGKRVSDASVQAKTGRTWAEWFGALDEAGAAALAHPEIVGVLREQFGLSGWWGQMVTVAYEQERGLRKPGQKADGFSVSASKTLAVPVSVLFQAWSDASLRSQWLDEAPLVVRRATPDRSLRITWADGRTSLEVNLYSKGAEKSQVAVEHNKLADAEEAARMKAFWMERVARLKQVLESASPSNTHPPQVSNVVTESSASPSL